MTTPAQRPTVLLFGRYSFPRSRFDPPGGQDQCEADVQLRIRETARSRGHEPEGRVSIGWYDSDPGEDERPVTGGPIDVDRKWCRALVMVRIHAARERTVGISCQRCGSHPEIRGDVLACPRCDR